MKDKKGIIKSLQAHELNMKLLLDEASRTKYAEKLAEDIAKLVPKLQSCIKGVEKILLTPGSQPLNLQECQRLDKKTTSSMDHAMELKAWGIKFGIVVDKKSQQ